MAENNPEGGPPKAEPVGNKIAGAILGLLAVCAMLAPAVLRSLSRSSSSNNQTPRAPAPQATAPPQIRSYSVPPARSATQDYFANPEVLGYSWYDKGEFHKAAMSFTEALRLDPSAKLYHQRGRAYRGEVEFDKAVADLTEAIRIYGGDPDFYYDRGLAYQGKRDFDGAIADFTEAFKREPLSRYAVARGNCQNSKGEVEKAMADYNDAIRLNPKDPEAFAQRAKAYAKSGDARAAAADREAAAAAFYNRGLEFDRMYELEKAVADFTEALRNKPNYVDALFNRGTAFDKNREFLKAIADYTEVIRIDPRYAAAYRNRAIDYTEMHDNARAEADRAKDKELSAK